MPSILLLWKDPNEPGQNLLQALAVPLAIGLLGVIAHKGHAEVTALTQDRYGTGSWVRLARYLIANIAS